MDFVDHGAESASVRNPSFAEHAQALIDAGLTLLPLNGKTPRDGQWQRRRYDSAAEVAAAEGRRNLGVRISGTDLLVVDADPRNYADGVDSFQKLVADCGIDLDSYPVVRTGGGGFHVYMRRPAGFEATQKLDGYPGIDIKTSGQVVAPGSIHPETGAAYVGERMAYLALETPAPAALLDLVRRDAGPKASTTEPGAWTPEELAKNLAKLDPDDFATYDAWREVMMASHHATNGEGLDEFVEWSDGFSGECASRQVIEEKWRGFTLGEGGITHALICKLLHERRERVHDELPPEQDFDEVETDVPDGYGVDDDKLRAEPKLSGVDAVIEAMNARHYVVLDNGFQVITEEPDPVLLGRVRYQRLSKSDFRSSYENQLVEKGEKLVSYADVWLKSAHRRQYKGMIFDPGDRDHEGWLNLWKGWAVEPKPGDWSLLRELILDVLVDGDHGHFEWVLDWIAFMFQNPDKVAEVAVAFRGAKGTGKGTLGRALANIAGAQGLHISSPGHLTGRFNSHLQNCVCLFADEAFWAGDKAGESVLKQLVTEPTLTYEGKGRDAVTGRNHVHIVMASNSDWVVPAGLDGERRFAVFDVNAKRQGDHAYFKALNRQLEQGGLAALLHDMLARDLRGKHPRENVPQTKALAEQKGMSMSPEESWWDDLLSLGELPFPLAEPDAWANGPLTVELQALHELYVDFVSRHKMGRARTSRALAMAIKKKAGIEIRQINRKWRWVIPQLEVARITWAKVTGRTD